MEKTQILSLLFSLLLLNLNSSSCSQSNIHDFIECVSVSHENGTILDVLFSPGNSSYSSHLNYPIQNLRFLHSNSTPLTLITPLTYSHVQTAVKCCKKTGLQIRIRSGGHDYEGLSYKSQVPFIILDLLYLRAITVDLPENTAWVESGATIGELYYWIAKASRNRAFPAGICPTVGVGGHFSGGGFGNMMRKYGIAGDYIIDAVMVDVNGRILDRKSMGEDVFWAIRGGGGSSFGVILSWKLELVYVPTIVTVFSIDRTLEEGAAELAHKWQHIASKLSRDLFIRLVIVATGEGSNRTIQITFNSIFFGRINHLVETMNHSFPKLMLTETDCTEMSWVESIMYFWAFSDGLTIDALRDRVQEPKSYFKATSDFVTEPLSYNALSNLWEWMLEEENPIVILDPLGGKMDEIPSSEIAFPHRKGNLFVVQYEVQWHSGSSAESEKHVGWVRRLYARMAPFVSGNPRRAYLNYRDLDFGENGLDGGSFDEARKWGEMYFDRNYMKLAVVKGNVDPEDFFRDEQSIPPLVCRNGECDLPLYQSI